MSQKGATKTDDPSRLENIHRRHAWMQALRMLQEHRGTAEELEGKFRAAIELLTNHSIDEATKAIDALIAGKT